MRIAIVADPYIPIPPPKYGGVEQVIYYLIKGLQDAGHEPILLASADSKVDCELIPIAERSLPFPLTRQGLKEHRAQLRKAVQTTTRQLKSLLPGIDLIHSHGFDLSSFKDLPNVTTLHNNIMFNDLEYYLKRRDLPYVSISRNQQSACPELNYIDVVYNGEDPDEFPLVTQPGDYVCFLGRFDRDKNPHLAIQLAITLGIKIKLAGKIDFFGEDYFKDEIKDYFKHPLVEYLGELDFKAKTKLLSGAKCNLHPTNFREPFGLTVLEAAYCGTPTMAIARGSMPELIEPDRTGLLVEDYFEGRHRLKECFEMDRKYIALRARQLFNYRTMSQHYVDVYKKVIAAPG
jgi:glycosyltransferase involved in cell wall biosynthesis